MVRAHAHRLGDLSTVISTPAMNPPIMWALKSRMPSNRRVLRGGRNEKQGRRSGKKWKENATHLLINNNINLHPLLCFALQHPIKTPFFVVSRWTTEVEFGGEPPVLFVSRDGAREREKMGTLVR